MQVTLTNRGADAPYDAGDTGGTLPSNTPTDIDAPKGVLIVGQKPSVQAQLGTAAETLKDALGGDFHDHYTPGEVVVFIENKGVNALRIVLGDGTSEFTLAPHAQFEARAEGYVEIRELGLASANLTEQPATA